MFTSKEKKGSIDDNKNIELIEKYRETGNEQYREEFFILNKKLPFYVAKTYKNSALSLDEIVSLANYGMLKAFNTFDTSKDITFATYSLRCMHNEILMEFRRLKKLKNQVSLEEILSEDSQGQTLTRMDILEANTSEDIEKSDTVDEIHALITHLMDELDERSQFVLSNMLNWENRVNQRDIAKTLNLSQSYISRLEKKITGKAKEIAFKLDLGNLTQFNSTYKKKKPVPMPPPKSKEVEADSPVVTYSFKEMENMLQNINVPKGTLRNQIIYLMDNHPELSRGGMAEILGKNVATIYSYVSEIKKTREKNKLQPTKKEIETVPEQEDIEELKIMLQEEQEVVKVEPKAFSKIPETVDLSLTGISGKHLQTLLFELLKNSVSENAEYSIAVTIERKK